MTTFLELAAIICIATTISAFIKILKQPLIIGYIITGIITGPIFLNLLQSPSLFDTLSKIGISVLLFIVGLNLNPKVIKEVGKVSLISGLLQVLITSLVGYFISLLIGLPKLSALYVSIALTFSSTIIILKLLSDKGDYHKLYGKIAIGFLLVQDVIASLILLFTSALSTESSSFLSAALPILLKTFLILTLLFLLNSFILPKLSSFFASNTELLFLFSLAWGLGLASVFYLLGLSLEIGSLIAGVSLSLTPFAFEVAAKLKPLRDFFIVLFFILLGSQINLTNLPSLLPQAITLSLFVLIGNPIILIILINLLGHKRRTSFKVGLTVAQISEFSLILASLGLSLGHISQDTVSLITLVGLITISGSTYLILYDDYLFSKIEWFLKLLELRQPPKSESNLQSKFEIVLFGYDRVGEDFVRVFSALEKPFLVVDFNPSSIEKLTEQNIPSRFGDAEDPDFLEELNLHQVKLAISTIPDFNTNLLITEQIKTINPKSLIIIITHNLHEAKALYDRGASYVVVPHYLGAKHIVNLLSRLGIDQAAFRDEREKHLEYLTKRLAPQ